MQLVGNKIPYQNRYTPTPQERAIVENSRAQLRAIAAQGVSVKETLAFIRRPEWRWMGET